MMKPLLSNVEWLAFAELLPKKIPRGDAVLPENLEYRGYMWVGWWVPPDLFWEKIRIWMQSRGEEGVFYFLLEGIKGEQRYFESDVAGLTDEELDEINVGYLSAVVAKDFSWAISSDDSKNFHVAGPEELYLQLLTWDETTSSETPVDSVE